MLYSQYMVKERVPIPKDIAAEILFLNDRTCCVCNQKGKSVQIHHIDEDPSNNAIENLSVLCLECHNDTMLKGGFGRKLDAAQVQFYKSNWIKRIQTRREEADKIALQKMNEVTAGSASKLDTNRKETDIFVDEKRTDRVFNYINNLPEIKRQLKEKYQKEWDTGVTSRMLEASYSYVQDLQSILLVLSKFYPPDSFEKDAEKFFSKQISERFLWHRSYAEPDGPGKSGTIAYVLIAGNASNDVENMIADVAETLVGYDDRFDWKNWRLKWKEQKQYAS